MLLRLQFEISRHTCCLCQTKKRRQLWLNEIKREDWTETVVKQMLVFAAHTSFQKRFNKVLSFVVMGASNDFYASRLCRI